MAPPYGQARRSGPICQFQEGSLQASNRSPWLRSSPRIDPSRHPPPFVRTWAPTVSERSNTLAPQNSAEGIATLAGAEALVCAHASLPNQPVMSLVSGIVAGFGQRIFASLVSLPLVQTGPSGT